LPDIKSVKKNGSTILSNSGNWRLAVENGTITAFVAIIGIDTNIQSDGFYHIDGLMLPLKSMFSLAHVDRI
jgi:hypothetical protein